MQDKEYIEKAVRTENKDISGISQRGNTEKNWRLVHAMMGISTESAELLDLLKKHIFYGKPLNDDKIFEELGDAMWYIALLCDAMGFDLEKVKAKNIDKLRARYPQNFTEKDAIERDLGKEKKALTGEA